MIIAFWESVVGAGAEERLQRDVLQCLPGDSKMITTVESLALLKNLGRGKFYSFLGIGPKALLSTALKFVEDIAANRKPQFDSARNSLFMREIMKAAGRWLQCIENDADGVLVKEHFGKSASEVILIKARKLQSDKHFQESRELLHGLRVFGWFLSDAHSAEVEKMGDLAIEHDLEKVAHERVACDVASSSKAPRGKTGGRQKTKANARDAVLSMLK